MTIWYEYRIYKVISYFHKDNYADKLVTVAEKCNIPKFACFCGHAYFDKQLHRIVRMEFGITEQLSEDIFNNILNEIHNIFTDEKFESKRPFYAMYIEEQE